MGRAAQVRDGVVQNVIELAEGTVVLPAGTRVWLQPAELELVALSAAEASVGPGDLYDEGAFRRPDAPPPEPEPEPRPKTEVEMLREQVAEMRAAMQGAGLIV